jgi:hypothetical protein
VEQYHHHPPYVIMAHRERPTVHLPQRGLRTEETQRPLPGTVRQQCRHVLKFKSNFFCGGRSLHFSRPNGRGPQPVPSTSILTSILMLSSYLLGTSIGVLQQVFRLNSDSIACVPSCHDRPEQGHRVHSPSCPRCRAVSKQNDVERVLTVGRVGGPFCVGEFHGCATIKIKS